MGVWMTGVITKVLVTEHYCFPFCHRNQVLSLLVNHNHTVLLIAKNCKFKRKKVTKNTCCDVTMTCALLRNSLY